LSQPFTNTLLVCFGTAFLAAFVGLTLALLTVCFRVPLHRWMSVCTLSLVFIPIYVQATAWSAGFGVTGWFRLSQVAAAMSPTTAIASVIWIQAMAMAPVCYLISAFGIRRSFDSNTRQALLDFGPWSATIRVLIPKLWPWIGCGAIWSIAMTGNDMVVTNLFQVGTITETVYQQVQFNDLDFRSIALACSFAASVGFVALTLIWILQSRLGAERAWRSSDEYFQAFELHGTSRWIGALVGWLLVAMVALIPIANLIIKGGWVARMEDDELRRGWSVGVLVQSITQASTFAAEIGWSLQISFYSTALALILGVGLVACTAWKWTSWWIIGAMVCLLAVPGPIVNLGVIWLLDRREPEWIGYLADRTLMGPILALQSRCLPVVFGILWLATHRFRQSREALLRLDRGLPWATRTWIVFSAIRLPLFASLVISFFVAFADLSSYLLVQPPQVTTVAMRMFDLLHYGIKNRESGLALALVFFGSIPALLFLRPRQMD
jgi:iron(III) transport system permease protein